MPEFTLPVSQEEYEKSGSKFITFSLADKPGKLYFKDIEMDVLDWDTPGQSLKFPVRIVGKDVDAGKEDKLSCGVAANAVWKLKDTLKSLGMELEMRKGSDGQKHPVISQTVVDAIAGKKAVGCWEIQAGHKGGDRNEPLILYPKLVSIFPSGYKPATKELV